MARIFIIYLNNFFLIYYYFLINKLNSDFAEHLQGNNHNY